jgi:hypothetical protein
VFTLGQVVPWGRSFDEYCRMFSLGEEELSRSILGCGDGPASFNAEATRRGHRVTSCDPIYRWTRAEIEGRVAATYEQVLAQTRQNQDSFVWDTIRSVEELGDARMRAMRLFFDDFDQGRRGGRYVEAALPDLPFEDQTFDLALCSHFLFLYSDHRDEQFHVAAVRELVRVAREVRIFPLLGLDGRRSPYVDRVAADLAEMGVNVSIDQVAYEFQRGGNEMLRIS